MFLMITTRADSYIQFITVLILFVLILAVTYFVTRWIAKVQKDKIGVGNLEVVETCRVTPNKYIQIVRAGEKYLVIAVGKDEIHMLSEISKDELMLREGDQEQPISFAGVLDRVKKIKEKEKD